MDVSYKYTPVRESDADFLELLTLMYTPDSISTKFRTNSNHDPIWATQSHSANF